MCLDIIWDIVCSPLGSGIFAFIWFSRLNRCALFYFGGGFTGLFNFSLVRVVFNSTGDLPTFIHSCFMFTHLCFFVLSYRAESLQSE